MFRKMKSKKRKAAIPRDRSGDLYAEEGRTIQIRISVGCTILFLILVFASITVQDVPAQIIPPTRTVAWRGNVGVDGGIPSRTTIYQTIQPGSNIQAALDTCPPGQVVYLKAGIYTVTSTITIPSNVTLRGAGIDSTVVISNSSINPVVRLGGNFTAAPGIGILSGFTKGSTRIVVTDASDISRGDLIRIDELNDPDIPVTVKGYEQHQDCTWCSRNNGTRARAQIVKVTGRTGNALDFTPAFFFDFSAENTPQFQKLRPTTRYAGVEDLTIKNGSSGGTTGRRNLYFSNAENCWAKNIKIDTCGQRGIDIYPDNFRVEIRDSFIAGCLDSISSDTCYGIQLGFSSSCLIENNIFHETSDGPMLMWGASGNVVSYNYLHNVHRDTQLNSWFWFDSWTHGAHTSFNLYEGNLMVGMASDAYWGSHSHNTFFRNRLLGKHPDIEWIPGTVQTTAFCIGSWNNYMNIVGNVLGTPGFADTYEVNAPLNMPTSRSIYIIGMLGDTKPRQTLLRHANYDYYSKTTKYCDESGEPGCHGGNASHIIPHSLYLVSKPAFFGSCAWPPFGSDLNPMTGLLPAKARYEGSSVCLPASGVVLPPQNLRLIP